MNLRSDILDAPTKWRSKKHNAVAKTSSSNAVGISYSSAAANAVTTSVAPRYRAWHRPVQR
jgi:hypothetical protein